MKSAGAVLAVVAFGCCDSPTPVDDSCQDHTYTITVEAVRGLPPTRDDGTAWDTTSLPDPAIALRLDDSWRLTPPGPLSPTIHLPCHASKNASLHSPRASDFTH